MSSGERMFFFESIALWVYLHPIHPLRMPGNCSHLEDIEPSKLGPLASLLKGWKVGRIRSTACLSELTNRERLKQHSQHIPKCHLVTVFSTKSFSKDVQPGESHRHGRIPQGMAKWTSMEVLWTKKCINVLFANSCVADPRGRRLKSHVVE